jgi:hypothetical protein
MFVKEFLKNISSKLIIYLPFFFKLRGTGSKTLVNIGDINGKSLKVRTGAFSINFMNYKNCAIALWLFLKTKKKSVSLHKSYK